MNNSKEYHDLIESYLEGSMSQDQEKAFLKELETDGELARRFNLRKKIKDYWIISGDYEATKKHVSHLIKKEKLSAFWSNKYFLIAASVVILLSLSWIIWNTGFKGDDEKQDLFTMEADSLKNDTSISKSPHQLQFKQSNYKAEIDSLLGTKAWYKIIQPENNSNYQIDDTIWLYGVTSKDTTVTVLVLDTKNDSVIFNNAITTMNQQFELALPLLKTGRYYCLIMNTDKKTHFVVNDCEK